MPATETDDDSDGYVDCTVWNDTQGDDGGITAGGDCDDSGTGGAINPGATEVVDNGQDDDCDGGELCYLDFDDDGYRPDGTSTVADGGNLVCTDAGEAESSDPTTDCDDSDSASNPGAAEVCDGNDNDCVGGVPATEIDDDLDTYVECSGWNDTQGDDGGITAGGDCNDANASVFPGNGC